MPTILILFGLKFRIYVRDHEPVHVHVLSQDGEAKFQVGHTRLNSGRKQMQPTVILMECRQTLWSILAAAQQTSR